MTLREAIVRADEIRPNAVSDELKASWISQLEGDIAELMGVETPPNTFPEDRTLLAEYPYDELYELWLCVRIDFANQESAQYANDAEIFNAAYSRFASHYRREHEPEGKKWKVW